MLHVQLHLYTCQEQGSDGDKSSSLVLKNVASTSIEEGKSLLSLDWDRHAHTQTHKCFLVVLDVFARLLLPISFSVASVDTFVSLEVRVTA